MIDGVHVLIWYISSQLSRMQSIKSHQENSRKSIMENVVSNDDSDRDNGDAVSKFEFSCDSSIEQV